MLCSGPGKLCQAMGVTRTEHNGKALTAPPFELLARGAWEARAGRGMAAAPLAVAVGPRIGISKAVELPWRFGEAGSRFLSRPFR
jgi:DNA-3-methyladenine glycosylase